MLYSKFCILFLQLLQRSLYHRITCIVHFKIAGHTPQLAGQPGFDAFFYFFLITAGKLFQLDGVFGSIVYQAIPRGISLIEPLSKISRRLELAEIGAVLNIIAVDKTAECLLIEQLIHGARKAGCVERNKDIVGNTAAAIHDPALGCFIRRAIVVAAGIALDHFSIAKALGHFIIVSSPAFIIRFLDTAAQGQ